MTDLLAETLANPAIGTIGSALALAAVALWLAAAWWAYTDAARRTESSLAGFIAAGWIILSTPLLLPLSLAAYAFARPQVPAADQRTRSLAAALASMPAQPTCAVCAAPIDATWRRCPTCTTWLSSPCGHCGRWSDGQLEICPWCGAEAREAPFVQGMAGAAATAGGRHRRPAWRAATPAASRSQRREGQRVAIANGAPRTTSRVRS